jgi:uncharacterized protein DUF6622
VFLEIIKRTPSWVFVLFFVLLALGYVQTKGRKVRRSMVFIVPVIMLALSFYGVLSAFGNTPAGVAGWLVGVLVAAAGGVKLRAPQGAIFSNESGAYFVPGSWAPLILIMLIFFIRYTVNVILARQLPIMDKPGFIVFISLCYGVLSGTFLARALVIWRLARQPGNAMSNTKMHPD